MNVISILNLSIRRKWECGQIYWKISELRYDIVGNSEEMLRALSDYKRSF